MNTLKWLISLGFLFVFVTTASSQKKIVVQKDLKIKVHHDTRTPLELEGISTDRSPFIKEDRYSGGERFLYDLRLKLVNRSEKNIVALQIQVTFSDFVNGKHSSPVIRFLRFGPQEQSEATNSYPVLISGYGTQELRLSDVEADALTTWFNEKGAFERSQILVYVYEVTYDDDTRWAVGRYLRRDTLDRTKWNIVFETGLGIAVKNTKIFAQSDQKKVEVPKTTTDQVNFSNLKVSGVPIEVGKKFSEGNGWLGRTTFDVTNVSEKEIIYLEVKISFPETAPPGRRLGMASPIQYGNRPGSRLPPGKPFSLPKGSKITIDLAEPYPGIAKFVSENRPINDITHVIIEASWIVFADETAWALGVFWHRDPANPSSWIQIDMPGYNPIRRPTNRQL